MNFSVSVAFEDETDRTASDYHVVQAGTPPFGVETTSESRSSASLATMTPSIVPSGLLPFSPGDLGQPRALPTSRPSSVNSLLPADTLVARPKLGSLNEAFLLRHFRKALGAWVCHTRWVPFSHTARANANKTGFSLTRVISIDTSHLRWLSALLHVHYCSIRV